MQHILRLNFQFYIACNDTTRVCLNNYINIGLKIFFNTEELPILWNTIRAFGAIQYLHIFFNPDSEYKYKLHLYVNKFYR